MRPDPYQARDIFLHAVGKLPPERWEVYVSEACAGDTKLSRRVHDLLDAHREAGSFLESPAVGSAETVSVSDPVLGPSTVSYVPPAEELGGAVGPYRLVQEIGEGGMGTVFLAHQTEPVQRLVALKVIKAGMDSRLVLARFEAERQALALMDHPNIAKVFGGGTTDAGRPYFVMELVKGIPLTRYCDEHRLTPTERLCLFVQVCQAVQHAHQKGIIHRDLKPSNVLVALYDGKPVVKVIDFGIAKAAGQTLTEKTLITGFGAVVGTPEYMSPEQAELNNQDIDTRSDIYSLGVLLYELLTGTTPLTRERVKETGILEVLRLVREEDPPRPSTRLSSSTELPRIATDRNLDARKLRSLLRGELDWVVMKALEKDRNRRYETATEFAADIQRHLAGDAVVAVPPSAGYRLQKFVHRNRREVLIAGVLSAAAAAGVSGLVVSRELISAALERERQEAYFQRITVAHCELSIDNLAAALRALEDCPEDLRGWEWRCLMRLCRVGPVVYRDGCAVNGLAFSHDGEHLATAGGDGALKIWDSRTGRVVRTLDDPQSGIVSGVAFHPGGKYLVSVGSDQQVKVWDLTTRRQEFTKPCDSVHVMWGGYAVAFDPSDGRRLAAGHAGVVSIWDWQNERPLLTLPGHDKVPICVAFSSDGRRMASGSWRGCVRLWDAKAGGEPFVIPETLDHRHPVSALAFSKDGRWLATASFERRVDVWDTTTGVRHLRLPHSGLVNCVAFSPDGRRIASAGEDKIVHIWDGTTGREVLGLRGHTGVCGCLAFSSDGLRLASASQDRTIRIWDASPLQGHEGQEERTYQHLGPEIWSLAVSPDGRQVVSAGFNATAKVWDAQTGTVSVEYSGHRDVVFCVAWDPKGRRIASAGSDRGQLTVKVWNAQTGVDDFALPAGTEYYVAVFSPDGEHLVTGQRNGTVQVWDARTGKMISTLFTSNTAIRGLAFSRDGKHLATADSDGEVHLWDASRLNDERVLLLPPLKARVHGPCLNIAFSPDGRRLATGGPENTVKVWDVGTGKVLDILRGHSGDVYTVAFSPDGRWVASAGEDSAVRVWDSNTAKIRHIFRGHTGLVSSLAFRASPDGLRLTTGSRDHTIKVWDVSKLEDEPQR